MPNDSMVEGDQGIAEEQVEAKGQEWWEDDCLHGFQYVHARRKGDLV